MNTERRRALLLAAAMGGAAGVAALVRAPRREAGLRPAVVLDTLFPQNFGAWQVDKLSRAFVRPADLQGKLYGIYDQLLERTFVDPQGRRIMLSVAFGSEQSSSLQLHRPEVCYRAGGYEVSGTHVAELQLAGRRVPATRLQAQLPGRFEPITYWTVLGRQAVAGPDGFRWRRVAAALRRELLDGLLVRVSSIDTDLAHAHLLQSRFADEMVRAIAPVDRDKVIGTPPEG